MNLNDISPASQLIQELDSQIKEEKKRFQPILLSHLLQMEFAETEWIVEGLIPADSIIGVSGSPATYKTWIGLYIGIQVSRGEPVFGKFPTTQTSVLLIDEENGQRLLHKRLKMLPEAEQASVYLHSLADFKLNPDNVAFCIAWTKENGVRLVILDSLVRMHNADENDAMKMANIFSLLKGFNKEGISVLFIHHNRKQALGQSSNPSQDMRGSSDILASLDCHLAVERKEKSVVIKQTKLRQDEEMKPFRLKVINENDQIRFEYAGEPEKRQDKKTEIRAALEKILPSQTEPLSKKQLKELLKSTGTDARDSMLKAALGEMVQDKTLIENQGPKRAKFYKLQEKTSEDTDALKTKSASDTVESTRPSE